MAGGDPAEMGPGQVSPEVIREDLRNMLRVITQSADEEGRGRLERSIRRTEKQATRAINRAIDDVLREMQGFVDRLGVKLRDPSSANGYLEFAVDILEAMDQAGYFNYLAQGIS